MENTNENETATFACKLIGVDECHVAICDSSSAYNFYLIEREVNVDSTPENSDALSTSNSPSVLSAILTRSDGICS
jgi:hypothetical protein